MNSPQQPTALKTPLELRVLEGEQQGACTVVDAGRPLIVSGDMQSDVVLRSGSREDFAFALRLRSDGARVRVLVRRGAVAAQGRAYGVGEKFDLPLYVPMLVGGNVIALGKPGHPDWAGLLPVSEAQATAASEPGEPAALAPGQPANEPAFLRVDTERVRSWPRRLVLGGGALASVSCAALVYAYSIAEMRPTLQGQAERIEAALRAEGYPGLGVHVLDNQISLSGHLETAAQRAGVEKVLARHNLPVRMAVVVNESVVAAVRDVLRVNGVPALAESTGPGAVTVRTQMADADLLEQIRIKALRDVPGLATLTVRNAAPSAVHEPARPIDDPGKRIASIVPGPSAYVVTSDGTRYFEGALLPTGHRIAEIREREVMLELNGVTTPLRF